MSNDQIAPEKLRPPDLTGQRAIMERLGMPDLDAETLALAAEDRRISKPSGNRASEIGARKDCARRLVYIQTNYADRKPPSDYLMGIFDTGKALESIDLIHLTKLGMRHDFEIIDQQRSMEWPKYNIVGHCDGIIAKDGKIVAGLEIKTVGLRFPSLSTIESLQTWEIASKWYGQAQLYMLLSNIEWWALRLINKLNIRETRTLWMPLDYEYSEAIVKRVELVNQHVKAGTLPEKVNDPRHCEWCDFAHICMPDLDYKGQVVNLVNPEAVAAKLRMDELKPKVTEYNKFECLFKGAVKRVMPKATLEDVGQKVALSVGEEKVVMVGRMRKLAAKEESTSYFWQESKKDKVA